MVLEDLLLAAGTFGGRFAVVSARTGVHGGDEDEVGGVGDTLLSAGYRDGTVFEGLPQGLDDGAGKFGEFVEKEDAAVGEGNFSRGGVGATADQRGVASTVVWVTKRTCAEDFFGGGT